MQKLNAALPRIWNRENPIDILKDASAQRWRDVIDICLSAREIHALIMIFVPHPFFDSVKIAETILALLAGRPHRPTFAVWMGGESVDGARRLFNQAAIPTYETPERAVAAFRYMRSYSRNLEMLQEIPPRLDKSLKFDSPEVDKLIKQSVDKSGGWLTDAESRKILEAYGIPVNPALVAYTSEQAVNIAGRIGYPVAIKINSRDIVHKTDARAVALNLDSDRSVQDAFRQITGHVTRCYPHADCQGITVEPMVKRPEIELIMGARKDAAFGPVIVFGAGGIMTDIIRDVGFALPPLNRLLARRLMESTRIYQMLGGYRNRPGANLEFLEEILIRLSQLVTDFPQIDLVEINPLILADDCACAVDARVIVKATSVKSSHHLVISPYPDEFEKHIVSKGGLDVFIRPIKPEDASLLIELMQHMSVRSIYYRFCKPVTLLPAKMLALFTQIDYDRDMALVALDSHDGNDKMFGVGRLVRYPDGKKAEFAIMVGDEWHGKGIGSALMRHLMNIARARGIETLWGLVLAENTQMLALGKKLGFTVTPFPDAGQHELEIDLRVAGA
ncbi:MAG: GNAT family N-acetyltransferase [Desulfobacterales bacterium]|nr:GNAT family N-acetyltransferase [Desulfobacterales bacterium]